MRNCLDERERDILWFSGRNWWFAKNAQGGSVLSLSNKTTLELHTQVFFGL